MTTPSGGALPPAPAPVGPRATDLALDPALVERMANAFFREAFAAPLTTPAAMPAPTESSAVAPTPGGAAPPLSTSVPGGLATAPAAASPTRGLGVPVEAPAGTPRAPDVPPGLAAPPTPSVAPPATPTPSASAPAEALGLVPPFLALSPAPFGSPSHGSPGLAFDAPFLRPLYPSATGTDPTALPPTTLPPHVPGAPASSDPASGPHRPPASHASTGADPAATPEEPPYWLRGASAPAAPPTCRHTRDLEHHLVAASVASAPQLASPVEAEAERQAGTRAPASPAPSLERLFSDSARFAAVPFGPGAPLGPIPGLAPTALAGGGLPVAAPSAPGAPATPAPTSAELYFLGPPAVPRPAVSSDPFDVETVRRDFPALRQEVHGRPLIWLDNAATTQKPQAVIDALSRYYARDNSNIHRAAHELARRATEAYENARDVVRRFLNASRVEEIVFVRGTTEAINLVAQSWGRQQLGPGDEIVLTTLEHHANIVPWQFVAREKGAVLKVVPITDRGEVILEEYARLLGPRTKLVATTQVSNSLGTVVPVREMAAMAHRHGVPVLVDGAQSVPHLRADVQELGADFFVFSGHKIFGPTGIGALYARKELLDTMPPWQGGGSMIRTVTFEQSTFSDPPAKFEAGTPNIADAVGLAAALEYVERLGIDRLERYEHELLVYAQARMAEVPGLRPIGTAPHKASVLSFVFDGVRVEDVGRYLDSEGIAVRAGHHCAMPSLARLGLTGTVRPSLAFYNTRAEVDRLVEVLRRFRHG